MKYKNSAYAILLFSKFLACSENINNKVININLDKVSGTLPINDYAQIESQVPDRILPDAPSFLPGFQDFTEADYYGVLTIAGFVIAGYVAIKDVE